MYCIGLYIINRSLMSHFWTDCLAYNTSMDSKCCKSSRNGNVLHNICRKAKFDEACSL